MPIEIEQLPPWGPKSVTGKTGRERQAARLAEAERKVECKAAKAAELDKVAFPKPKPKPEPTPKSTKRTRESQTPAEREKANRAAARRLREWKRTHG